MDGSIEEWIVKNRNDSQAYKAMLIVNFKYYNHVIIGLYNGINKDIIL